MSDVSKANEDLIADLRSWDEDDFPHSIVSRFHAAADALEAATRVPVQGEPNACLDHKPVQHRDGKPPWCNACGRATVPDAATELAAIKARAEEVGQDEGWHIGGAWGDYGEVVVPLRILSYVVDSALDEKIVSTDPGYAATYAEQVSRADRAEAERDAALAAIERVRALETFSITDSYPAWTAVDYDDLLAALDGAPEPEEKP